MDNCPHCKASLIGDPIPEADLQHYGGKTNWRREIGIEDPYKYDGVWEWMCPDCEGRWPSAANIRITASRAMKEHENALKKLKD